MMPTWRPESDGRFRVPAPAEWRRRCSGFSKRRKSKIAHLAGNSGAGHWRKELTDEPVKFFPIYSYLIVYRPDRKPLEVVAILHGNRDVRQLLKSRLEFPP